MLTLARMAPNLFGANNKLFLVACSLWCTLVFGLSAQAQGGPKKPVAGTKRVSGTALAAAAMQRAQSKVTYNGAHRALGIDLQVLVHGDMQTNFSSYPTRWGLSQPDSNIDHRLPEKAILPSDILSFRLTNGLPHIGIVSAKKVPNTKRYYIVYTVGHYRFLPAS